MASEELPLPYDRRKDLEDFDNTKAGVKGLVDAGIQRVPRIFVRPPDDADADGQDLDMEFEIPVIDLGGVLGAGRSDIVSRVGAAARDVGFFQVVNHGVGKDVLERMLEGARAFHDMERDAKAEYYTRDLERLVKFTSNFDLFKSKYANWRDTLYCQMEAPDLDPGELPAANREIVMDYSKRVKALGITLLELLSEALGLDRDYLKDLDCAMGHSILCHYYPACPEPHLTMGTIRHSDPSFLTVVLQDDIGGLEVMYRDQWVGVPPLSGALVVNIGDLLQLMTNDIYVSVEHRVRANHVGPRLSVAFFFNNHMMPSARVYGPIKELLSDDNPALYKEVTVKEFSASGFSRGLDGKRKTLLSQLRLQTINVKNL
ncbi:hypothetical protein MLD38_011968 [Melastoma candidum]|uniref:Uncharacterized protein n=1 Tax=Melastoma candidum TaxID=119954 RepID=A0ACB9R8D5_9MYRT|nr:hypothetical protein MLD38_011968 [Melastoma candidum]